MLDTKVLYEDSDTPHARTHGRTRYDRLEKQQIVFLEWGSIGCFGSLFPTTKVASHSVYTQTTFTPRFPII